jgi:hypothetical protein
VAANYYPTFDKLHRLRKEVEGDISVLITSYVLYRECIFLSCLSAAVVMQVLSDTKPASTNNFIVLFPPIVQLPIFHKRVSEC